MVKENGNGNGPVVRFNDIEVHSEPSVRLTVPVRPDQEEVLSRMVRTISQTRSRQNRSQRITKATLMRAYIDALSSLAIDLEEIADEATLLDRLLEAMHQRPRAIT
jgi:hypothetical protein